MVRRKHLISDGTAKKSKKKIEIKLDVVIEKGIIIKYIQIDILGRSSSNALSKK